MKFDDALFRHALTQLPLTTAQQFRPATAEFLTWLQQNELPAEVIAYFAAFSVPGESSVQVGFASFDFERMIRTFHDDMPGFFRTGWLIVGSMPNGDFVVFDFHDDGAIGYVSHEEVWDAPDHVRDDLRNIYIRVCDSIGGFLSGLLTDQFPYDYFDARERSSSTA